MPGAQNFQIKVLEPQKYHIMSEAQKIAFIMLSEHL